MATKEIIFFFDVIGSQRYVFVPCQCCGKTVATKCSRATSAEDIVAALNVNPIELSLCEFCREVAASQALSPPGTTISA